MKVRLRWVLVGSIGLVYAVGATLLVLWPDGEGVRQLLLRVYLFGLYDLGVPATISPDDYADLGNVLLFVPAGLALALLMGRRRGWLTIPVSAVLGVLPELTQALLLPDRVADLRDVVTNALGATVGAVLGLWWLKQAAQVRRSR